MLDANTQIEQLHGKPFPCPICKKQLPIKMAFKQKPYCICQGCGVQVFFRTQSGIGQLHKMLKDELPMEESFSGSSAVVALYNRLEELRAEKLGLEGKQGIIFRDRALDDTIAALAQEIGRIENSLAKINEKRKSTSAKHD